MNNRFLEVSERLDEVCDAYEALAVLIGTADPEHYKLQSILNVFNKELKASLDELDHVRKGKPNLKSVNQVST